VAVAVLAGCGTGTSPAPADSSTSSAVASTSVCGLPAVELAGGLDVAPAATWEMLGTTWVPGSDEAGPGLVDDETGLRTCFAQTPTGALFAAINVGAAGSTPATARQSIERLLQAGPGRDDELAKFDADPDAGAAAGDRIEFVGFSVPAYGGTSAKVDLLVHVVGTGVYMASMVDLVWDGGDWKVKVVDDVVGIETSAASAGTAGYVPFTREG
jgi:hypothetical protein